ncbi:tyrosine-type recombinase/integrase [Brucella inopinata]|uniref:tyrosine-type recombinase/integrase n=1 Tax=Brucella inopinata TaxID=1218315 RepID=UPI0011AB8537|nr:site-specific integrase [Brucella inopinata]
MHTLLDLKKFFYWLETVAPAKSIHKGLSIYFAPSRELSALADVREEDRAAPSLEQVRTMILAMPAENFVQKRDQALLAFMLISGVRISALLTLQLQHINLERRSIRQDPRVVRTKNPKAMQTAWFPVGDDIEAIFKNWIVGLQTIHKNHSTPLFPRATDPIRRERSPDEIPPLMDQGTVRKIIKRACATVKLPYFNPHAIRRTLALLGNDLCNTAKLRKAWSQNLGHEHVATTDHYYAKLDIDEQLAAFDDIRANVLRHDADELVRLLPQLTAKQIAAITQVARGYTESDVLA